MPLSKHRKEYHRHWYKKHINRLRKYKARLKREWRKKNPQEAKTLDQIKHQKYKIRRNRYSNEYYVAHKNDVVFKRKRNKRSMNYYYNNKWKAQARRKVSSEIRAGKLIRPEKCERCGHKGKIEAHHPDLRKALEVIWLCKKCHTTEHQNAALSDMDSLKSSFFGEKN